MIKSQKVRSLTATTLMAGAACVGAGCASTPERPLPPREECPPEALAAQKQLGIEKGDSVSIFFTPNELPKDDAAVSEKDVTALLGVDLKEIPLRSPLYGKLYFTKNRVEGRFTRVRLRSGEIVPVCMEIITKQGFGIVIQPGSTLKKTLASEPLYVMVVPHFG